MEEAVVAVVEDDEQVRTFLERLLTRRGYKVLSFGSGHAARETLTLAPPDLLIADVCLGPNESGLDLVSDLRQRFADDVLPVIILSGLGSEEDFLRGFEAGASDYLAKPVTGQELLAKCVHQLRRARSKAPTDRPRRRRVTREVGPYTLCGVLGRGSYGTVHAAKDRERGIRVALKLLTEAAARDPEVRQRFQREIASLSSVRSPHVARLLDCGELEGAPYLAMELIAGPNLNGYLGLNGPLPIEDLIALLRGLGKALEALRAAELVHRDIKPGNVILRKGDVAEPVLVDFGLARQRHVRGVTARGDIVGSPGYMAPEYVMDGDMDARTDLYALGMVAIFAGACQLPFPDLEGIALIGAMARNEVEIPGAIPEAIHPILRRLTRLDPNERYQHAGQMLEALDVLEAELAGAEQA